MKPLIVLPSLLAIVALAIPTAACSFESDAQGQEIAPQGSGDVRSYAVRGFTAVEATGSDSVDVHTGRDFSVRANGAAKDLDQLRIARDGDKLVIGLKKGVHWGNRKNVRVSVTLPRLTGAGVGGSGRVTVDRVEGPQFRAGVAGSGDLVIGAMRVGHADLGVAGSGSITASRSADTLKVGVAGSGNIQGAGLRARQAKVGITGSGDVKVQVDGPAQVGLTGSGSADLGPNSVCTVGKTGSGSARCGRYAHGG